MEEYIKTVKIRVHDLELKIIKLRTHQDQYYTKSRELLIRGLESNVASAKEMLFHLDQPEGMIH